MADCENSSRACCCNAEAYRPGSGDMVCTAKAGDVSHEHRGRRHELTDVSVTIEGLIG